MLNHLKDDYQQENHIRIIKNPTKLDFCKIGIEMQP